MLQKLKTFTKTINITRTYVNFRRSQTSREVNKKNQRKLDRCEHVVGHLEIKSADLLAISDYLKHVHASVWQEFECATLDPKFSS